VLLYPYATTCEVDKGGQKARAAAVRVTVASPKAAGATTLSATSFAELTGVSRERLRTWERRYGFPLPQRVARGPRRYVLDDAGAVVAVRRAAEEGVPLPRAIAAARKVSAARRPSASTMAAVAEHLPAPLMLLSGPAPARVEYVNPALAALNGAPRVGDELAVAATWFAGSEVERAVKRVFATAERSVECAHPGWSDPNQQVRSLVYRLPSGLRETPVVAVVQLERRREREAKRALAEAEAARENLDEQLGRHQLWLGAIAELAELFQRESGPALLRATAETLVRRLPPIDAGVAIYMGGELALGSSSRGLLGPQMVTVAAYPDLAAILRDRTPAWLEPASAAAFGARGGLSVLAVPVAVVAETLGALLLVADETGVIDDEIGQLLSVLSASIGFALLRDRLVEGARGAAR
jgi:MerR family transcriptional regulator, light-induced transcriptional regulator